MKWEAANYTSTEWHPACTGNLPLQSLSLSAWFSLLLTVSQQSKPGWGKVLMDRPALFLPSGIYIKVSLRPYHATPFSITVPALLHVTLIQQSTRRAGRSLQRGLRNKGCPHVNTQQLSKVKDCKIWMWNVGTTRPEGKGSHKLVYTDFVALRVE